jgi:hypothetical protein
VRIPVTAGKLMARKRPRLIPIVDSVVKKLIQAPGSTGTGPFRSSASFSGSSGPTGAAGSSSPSSEPCWSRPTGAVPDVLERPPLRTDCRGPVTR